MSTIRQIAQDAFDRIAPEHTEAEAGIHLYEIERFVPFACESVADMAVQGKPVWRQYVEKTLTLTLAAGFASLRSYLLTGTASLINGSSAVAGAGTAFATELETGDLVEFAGDVGAQYTVATITSPTAMTVVPTWQQLTASWALSRSLARLRVDSLPKATIELAGVSKPLVYVSEPSDLYYPMIGQDFYYYAIERGRIRVRGPGNETLDSAAGALTIRNAVFTPTVGATSLETTLHPFLEDVLVSELVKLIKGKLEAKAVPKRD